MLNMTIESVRKHLRRPGVTKRQFAMAAGLHPNTLTGVEADEWNPTLATLRALEREVQAGAVHTDANTDSETITAPGKCSDLAAPSPEAR